uniref:Uncharacterized protein n=1 Tax=Anguilla anguilla TaxID=7936 RepID=A0A0E9VSJ1_ANGAN
MAEHSGRSRSHRAVPEGSASCVCVRRRPAAKSE